MNLRFKLRPAYLWSRYWRSDPAGSWRSPRSKFGAGRRGKRSLFWLALAAALPILFGTIYYARDWRGSGVRDLGFPGNAVVRPLQARITGGLAYRPYERNRGPQESKTAAQPLANEVLVRLTYAVATRPTVEARQDLGRFYLLMHDLDQAEAQLAMALEKAPDQAQLHTDLGALFYERSFNSDPFTWLSKAVDHCDQAIKVDPQMVEAWFNRALCHYQMALFKQAREDWERYLQLDPKSPWSAEAREGLRLLQTRVDQTADQNQQLRERVREAAATGNEQELRRLVTEQFPLVNQLATQELFDEYLKDALAGEEPAASARLKTLLLTGQLIAEIKGDRYLIDLANFAGTARTAEKREIQKIRALLQQADREIASGVFDNAFRHYEEAHRAAKRIGDSCHADLSSINLARFYNIRAGYHGLEAASKHLIASTEGSQHRQLHARALNAISYANINALRFSRSLDLSLTATKIAKDLGDSETAITSLMYVGAVYLRMGDYERAGQKNFEALVLMRSTPLPPFLAARVYAMMGETLLMAGNYQRALDYNQQGWQVAEGLNNPGLLAALGNRLGLNYWKLGRQEEAVKQLNDAIVRTEAITDPMARLLLQVELYTPLGDFYLRQNKVTEAIAEYQRALNLLENTNHRVHLFAIHQGLAAAYRAQGRIAEAESALQTSLELAERDRQQINDARGRSVYLFNRQDVYHAMMEFQFFTKKDPPQAYNYAEISKSRDLLDVLTGRTEPGESDGSRTLKVSGSAHPLGLKQIQQALPANAQLLEYSLGEDHLLIWLVTREEVLWQSLELKTDQLRQSIKDYLEGIRRRRELPLINRQAAELYQTLISPIAGRLDRNRVLCVVPDGILSQLPFGALISPETGRYLIEDYAITVNPSASVMAQALAIRGKKSSGAESFLGLGNPRFSRQRFPSLPALPSSEAEVNRVKSDYQKAQLLSRDQATESSLVRQIGESNIVHLATHVLINEQAPLLSSIVLAEEGHPPPVADRESGSEVFDGNLQAYEIYQLRLARTRLVILSGCRSALGFYLRGEALSGLAQAFLAAGVPAVIASLWDVDDDSTAELMRAFHSQYRLQRRNFAESLRQAQCALITGADAKYRHPYYWAAFLLTGDGCETPPKN